MYGRLCRGWYIGTKEGKKALLKKISDDSAGPGKEKGVRSFFLLLTRSSLCCNILLCQESHV
jgi:hypothetical protein